MLVEKAQPLRKSVGGIVLPDSAQTKLNYGTIVEVGQGRRGDDGRFSPLSVKKGDLVMLSEWGGTSVKINDKDLFVVREDEILGIVEKDD